MCGIAGKICSLPDQPVEEDVLQAMCHSLGHRGPDGWGMYLNGNAGLAVRRLAIIDLETGNQPIHNEDRTVWAVHNGEIYNFRALRAAMERRGHRFYTRSDTEVIVHLYEEYGLDFVHYLNGMFAIAVWCEREQHLVLVRDRLGIKPLFYAHLPERLLFGSEIKAILAEGLRPSLDLEALCHYLSLLYIPAPFTIYREIRKLRAGHLLIWEDGEMLTEQYWSLASLQPMREDGSGRDMRAIQAELLDLLTDAVRSRLVSDVPLGAFLSGGLDSSTVVALMRRVHDGPIKTFSIGFDDPSYDELPEARLIARRFDTEHTELTVTPDAVDLVPKLVKYFDEPFADSSAVAVYYLSQMTRQDVAVALGGDGGDEIFAGYITYQADKLARLYERIPTLLGQRLVPALVHRLPASDGKVSLEYRAKRFVDHAQLDPGLRHYAWKAFFDDDLKRAVLSDDIVASCQGCLDTYPLLQDHYEAVSHHDSLNGFLYADAKVYLPGDILVKVDRMSMAHGLEVRVPFLDHRVVEFAFRLPGRMKMPGLQLKHLLRETMRGLLPRQTLRRPKRGFNVPIPSWIRDSLQPLVTEYLSPATLVTQGIFDHQTVSRLVHDHLAGRADYSRNIWALLVFNLWYETYGG